MAPLHKSKLKALEKKVKSLDATLEEVITWYEERMITECDGNMMEAARRLGISRSTLYDHVNG